ncbi:hypothetical protein AAMO2058_001483400 [Amorphochlora amoebiformis]
MGLFTSKRDNPDASNSFRNDPQSLDSKENEIYPLGPTSNLPESDSLKVFGEARISGQVYVVELKMVDKTYHLKTGTEDSWEVFLGRVSAVTGIESDRLRLINMNKSVYRDTYTHYGPTNKFFGYPVYIITRLRNTSASARSEPKPAQSKQ